MRRQIILPRIPSYRDLVQYHKALERHPQPGGGVICTDSVGEGGKEVRVSCGGAEDRAEPKKRKRAEPKKRVEARKRVLEMITAGETSDDPNSGDFEHDLFLNMMDLTVRDLKELSGHAMVDLPKSHKSRQALKIAKTLAKEKSRSIIASQNMREALANGDSSGLLNTLKDMDATEAAMMSQNLTPVKMDGGLLKDKGFWGKTWDAIKGIPGYVQSGIATIGWALEHAGRAWATVMSKTAEAVFRQLGDLDSLTNLLVPAFGIGLFSIGLVTCAIGVAGALTIQAPGEGLQWLMGKHKEWHEKYGDKLPGGKKSIEGDDVKRLGHQMSNRFASLMKKRAVKERYGA